MSIGDIERIANTIGSRPVLGHWPHMQAHNDIEILRALAAELAASRMATETNFNLYRAGADRIRALEAALRESGEQLRMGAYHVGELGMAWTATIVTPECQKIQRTLKAAYQASLTAHNGFFETEKCKHGNGENCPDCAAIRRGRSVANRRAEHE